MKVLYDLIKEVDPEELWDSLNLTTLDMTPERVDAFLAVHRKVMETQPEYQPSVLERVKVMPDISRTIFLAQSRDLSASPEGILVKASNLKEILSLHIPSKLIGVCRTTVINELFRCLIREELEKPKYHYKLLRRKMVEEIEHFHPMLADRCAHNRQALEKAKEVYEDQNLRRMIRQECQKELPEMGRKIYWNELIGEAQLTENFCRSLLPSNPPAFSRLNEVKRIIKTELEKTSEMEERSEDDSSPFPFGEREAVLRRIRMMMVGSGTIIVEKNQIPELNIPIIYKVGSGGAREEIVPADLLNPLAFAIVVHDKQLESDRKTLAAYLLLYLAYPLRMHRVMKELQVKEIARLISTRTQAV